MILVHNCKYSVYSFILTFCVVVLLQHVHILKCPLFILCFLLYIFLNVIPLLHLYYYVYFVSVMDKLTLVLIGEINSIEFGSKNILLDNDKQENREQFSNKLYDLCGRHILVINMLDRQNIESVPVHERIHASLLLIPYGHHNHHYSSGLEWLEKTFGKESLSSVITVLTHESDENCESALTELKANSTFDEKRYHTCRRHMGDEMEIINLLKKIDDMVTENDLYYTRAMCDEQKEQSDKHLDPKSNEEEYVRSSVLQQNQTGEFLMLPFTNYTIQHCYTKTMLIDQNVALLDL